MLSFCAKSQNLFYAVVQVLVVSSKNKVEKGFNPMDSATSRRMTMPYIITFSVFSYARGLSQLRKINEI
ncbi:MAG: hypothetical protein LBN20_02830 [Endomicrobium sp.]|nr:hypothetical protein [Endomicrobium sp.]